MESSSIIGVDLGGTKIALTRYRTGSWEVEDASKIDTHADQTFDHVYDDMVKQIAAMRTDGVTSVGVGVPGLVTQPAGSIVTLPNIAGAEGFSLKERLENDLGLPVSVDNDANCFTLAEALHGAGKGHNVVVGITMGTGVGGGIVVDGKIFHGSRGYAAEIGHMLLKPGEPPFETENKRGDVEQFFSGTALGKRCQQASDPSEYLEGETCAHMHGHVTEEIAWMCVNLIHLIDPAVIVFGGSAGHALEPHLPDVLKELENWTLPGTPLPQLTIATLTDAGTRGAALLA